MEKIRKDQSTNCFPFNADEKPHFGEMSKLPKKNEMHNMCLLFFLFGLNKHFLKHLLECVIELAKPIVFCFC